MKPHISVYIPVYQGASALVATLRPILACVRADFEVAIRDNGSTDGISDAVAGSDGLRIRLARSEGTLSLPANRRTTVEQARSELIKMMCIDDLIHPGCLVMQTTLLEDLSLVLVTYHRDFIDDSGRILTRNAGLPKPPGCRDISEVARVIVRFGINPVGESTCVMFRRKGYDAIGGFSGSNVFIMDINARLRILIRDDMPDQPRACAAFRIWTELFSNSYNQQQLGDHPRFLKQVANNPHYEIPIVLRHLAPVAVHVSWRARVVRQRL